MNRLLAPAYPGFQSVWYIRKAACRVQTRWVQEDELRLLRVLSCFLIRRSPWFFWCGNLSVRAMEKHQIEPVLQIVRQMKKLD